MKTIRKNISIFDSVKAKQILMDKTIYTSKTVDAGTGEITEIKTITRRVEKQEHFIKMYIDDLASLIGCSNSEKNFILCAIQLGYIEYETNEIVLNKARKESIAVMAGIDYRSMQNSLYRLIKKNAIVNHEGRLMLNPKLFFCGNEKERAKIFELRIQYQLK